MLMFFVAAVPAAAQRTPREELEKAHEGVRFYEVGGRVRIAYGVPMTAGETPEEAAANWLTLYGEIFIDSREPGGPDLHLFSNVHTRSGMAILAYMQRIDGVPVESSSARVMTFRRGGLWRVSYASALVGLRPVGGLPEPKISVLSALRSAQEHEAGLSLSRWYDPQHVAIYEDSLSGSEEARPVWKCVGSSGSDSRTFYVDALTGEVLSHFSNVSHAYCADISGTVTGNKSPGTKPDRSDSGCENLPAAEAMPLIKVEARDGSTLVASALTNEDGDYVLDYNGTANVTVTASLEFPTAAWTIIDVDGGSFVPNCPGVTVNPVSAFTNATSPSTGVDLLLNTSPSEFATAQTNASHGIWKTRKYVKDRLPDETPPLAGLDDVIEVFVNVESGAANARYIPDCYGCNNDEPCLVFSPTYQGCINTSYSTWMAHEYGHYLLDKMRGIGNNETKKAFHEGWSDALALLTFGTNKWGEDLCLSACNTAVRDPQGYDPSYPVCSDDAYDRSMLLSALWLDLVDTELGMSYTRQLHVDWMLIAQAVTVCATCTDGCRRQAAAESTLIQVLTVDDDDATFVNGTPNLATICAVFQARNITTSVCDQGLRGWCWVDCDPSTSVGVLDIFDFFCFANRFTAGHSYACDCDISTGSGVCDVFDFLCFQAAFTKGCP